MLRIENISYYVTEGNIRKDILTNINLHIQKGETVVITGHNGSGKSTLVKTVMGLVPVTSGKIYFNDIDITNMSISERAKLGIAYAFQNPVRFKGLKVKDILSTAQKTNAKISDVCNYLSRVGLCARQYIDRELDDSLSGGELKRIEIASTLARGAKLNIFDEPEAGIDLWSFDGLVSAFRDNKEIDGGTNIVISHQERLMSIADKIVVMNESEISKVGTPQEILPTLTIVNTCKKLQGDSYE